MIYESGTLDTAPTALPLSIGDPELSRMARSVVSVPEMFGYWLQGGWIRTGFLGAAQIDRFASLNSTVIGDYRKPKVRFPGSGGANDFASFCWRTLMLTVHNARRFVNKVDFITSPGYLTGPGERERAGLPAGTGPYKIVTNLAVLGFDAETKEMKLESLMPGVTVEEVKENTEFDLLIPESVPEVQEASGEELRVLREEVDPHRYIIGR